MKQIFLRSLSLVALPLLLAACNSQSTGPVAEGDARLSLLLTDAPGDLRAAVVTISDIYLQGGDATGRIYLRQDDPVTTDLLSLANDVVELVDDHEIPAGRYSQLRFVISGAYIELEDSDGGTTVYATSPDYEGLPAGVEVDGELQCPSCAQSGFKVLLGPVNGDHTGGDAEEVDDVEVVLEGEETLLVDFDVSRSFGHEAGNSGKWVMRPTLKATRLVTAAEVVVNLGLDDPELPLPELEGAPLGLTSFTATLTPAGGGDPRTAELTDADGDGVYEARFGYLFPGEYSVGLVGPEGIAFLTNATLPVAVEVSEGGEATVDLRLTEITLGE
ncbi:MAG TPA: DUF4382 domain-containing protein [Longimicrobiaceae bacterium]